MGEKIATCKSCLFWNRALTAPVQTLGHGGKSFVIEQAQCRRYAPIPIRNGTKISWATWPHVTVKDWCGEFAPAIEPAEAKHG